MDEDDLRELEVDPPNYTDHVTSQYSLEHHLSYNALE